VSDFEDQWRRRFERFGTSHQSDHLVSGWSLAGLRQRVGVFEGLLDRGLLASGSRVLELGCAAGTYVRLLGKRGHPVVVGLDYSLPSLCRAAEADPGRLGRYVAGSAYALPFPARAFDAVICIGVLQALENPDAAIAEMARILVPGGRVLVETLNPWSPLAVVRRLAAVGQGRPTRLRYGSAAGIKRVMAHHGLGNFQQVGIVLPPKSLPRLTEVVGRPALQRLFGQAPGIRAVAAHAFWLAGTKA
jgi:SAM-dependent methyltransferase